MLLGNQPYKISQLLDEMEVIARSTVDSVVMVMQPFEQEEKVLLENPAQISFDSSLSWLSLVNSIKEGGLVIPEAWQ